MSYLVRIFLILIVYFTIDFLIFLLYRRIDYVQSHGFIKWAYWTSSIIIIMGIIMFSLARYMAWHPSIVWGQTMFALMIIFFVPKLVFLPFALIDAMVAYLAGFAGDNSGVKLLARRQFLAKTGLALAGVMMARTVYGIVVERLQIKLEKIRMNTGISGWQSDPVKVVHISDLHLGSFMSKEEGVDYLTKVNELIQDQEPDLILFTGDIVNDMTDETRGYEQVWSTYKAKYGSFAILGNHDYGDYVHWDNPQDKVDNLIELEEFYKSAGFKLLRNANETININGHKLSLVGVENWGQPPLPQYGDLKKAMTNLPESDYTILMSHDPTHWSAEVTKSTNIPLTLSGHTHGFQFAIKFGNMKWSPVQYKYKHWGGLYTESQQHLNVNIGFGYIGFPGRVGTRPTVSLIELS